MFEEHFYIGVFRGLSTRSLFTGLPSLRARGADSHVLLALPDNALFWKNTLVILTNGSGVCALGGKHGMVVLD